MYCIATYVGCATSVGCATYSGCAITGTPNLLWDLFPEEIWYEVICIQSKILPSLFPISQFDTISADNSPLRSAFSLLSTSDTCLYSSGTLLSISTNILRFWIFMFSSISSHWSELNAVPMWLSTVTTFVLFLAYVIGWNYGLLCSKSSQITSSPMVRYTRRIIDCCMGINDRGLFYIITKSQTDFICEAHVSHDISIIYNQRCHTCK